MRWTILLLVAMATMLASYVGTAIPQASPPETLDANSLPKYPSSTTQDRQSVLNRDWFAAAQTFTAINSGAITSAQIQMYKQCDTAGDVRMQIATVDGSGQPTNTILAQTTLPASAFVMDTYPNVGDLVTVKFSNPALVEAGRKYAIISRLRTPSHSCPGEPVKGTPYFLPLKHDVYAGGTSAYFPDYRTPDQPPSGGWGLHTGRDRVFAIYVTPSDAVPGNPAERCTISGTKGSDFLRGTMGRDVICAKGGSDVVKGRGGADVLRAGPGGDAVEGGAGADRLYGQRGSDSLVSADGVRGNDAMDGGGGTDACVGDRGDAKKGCES
jgi:hypothetical protein